MSTNILIVKAMIFSVVMYRYESWNIKKAEHQRFNAFELWCWRRLLRVPWSVRRSNQSILKEINPVHLWIVIGRTDVAAEAPIFGHLMRRANSLEKSLILGKIESRRRRGWQDEMVGWHHQLNWHEFEQALGVGDGRGSLACCSPWGHKELDTTERLNWTRMNIHHEDYLA